MFVQGQATGYKPEFSLGALYQGEGAADADAANAQDLIRQYLANTHDAINNPIVEAKNQAELGPLRYQNALAVAKQNDPTYIPQMLAGQKGEQQTMESSGAIANALTPFKIALAKAVANGDIDEANAKGLLAKFNLQAMQPPEQNPDATIPDGFSMPNPGPSKAGHNAFFPQGIIQPEGVIPQGSLKSEAAMRASMGTGYNNETATPDYYAQIDKAIAQAKDPKILAMLQEERANMGAPQVPTPVFSNMQLADNSDRERTMRTMMDTPEFRQKKELADIVAKASQAKAEITAKAQQLVAQIRADAIKGKPPGTVEAAAVREIMSNPNLSQEDRYALYTEHENAKNQAKNASATEKALGTTDQGTLGLVDRPVNPPIGSSMSSSAPNVKSGALSDEDAKAKQWALSNPNDPRAKDVLKKVMAKTIGK